jgi:nucleotide-binding universal stress UspA family protein
VLIRGARNAEFLVVGKRSLGTFGRLVLGSTSTACAGRSAAPVFVVPPGWHQQQHALEPVVVGVDVSRDEEATLALAVAEAARRGVALVAIYVVDIEPVLAFDPTLAGPTYQHWEADGRERLTAMLAPWRRKYPEVPTRAGVARGHAATALLDRAHRSQLLVIGRHGTGPFGFGLGSRARPLLHYADSTVLVVPEHREH